MICENILFFHIFYEILIGDLPLLVLLLNEILNVCLLVCKVLER